MAHRNVKNIHLFDSTYRKTTYLKIDIARIKTKKKAEQAPAEK